MTNARMTRTRGWWRAAAIVLAGVVGGALLPAAPAAAVHGPVPRDFNGDGYRDAVLPAPGANVSGKESAGAVVVLYGSASGLSTTRRKTITQNTSGVPGTSEAYDGFGTATTTADLNRDGYADLVVSTPYEDTSQGADSGLVTVLWGGSGGLTNGTNLPTPSDDPGYFGLDVAALSSGPGPDTEVLVSGYDGSVRFRGPFRRTGTFGSASLNQRTPSVETVALGDVNEDLSPDEAVITSRMSGLTGGEIYLNPESGADRPTSLKKGNGLVAAYGDLNGDGYDDLVVGDPDEPEVPGADGALGGSVSVWYGSADGIATDAQPVRISQDTAGVPGTSEKYDAFGGSVAVVDLNHDDLADIVVGTPYESLGGAKRAGMVTVIPGRASGALGTGSYSYTQDTSGMPGSSETDDFFGTTVSAADINRDGKPELFISASGENLSLGAVWVLPGASTRPTTTGSRMILPSSVGLTQSTLVLLGGNGLLNVI